MKYLQGIEGLMTNTDHHALTANTESLWHLCTEREN